MLGTNCDIIKGESEFLIIASTSLHLARKVPNCGSLGLPLDCNPLGLPGSLGLLLNAPFANCWRMCGFQDHLVSLAIRYRGWMLHEVSECSQWTHCSAVGLLHTTGVTQKSWTAALQLHFPAIMNYEWIKKDMSNRNLQVVAYWHTDNSCPTSDKPLVPYLEQR